MFIDPKVPHVLGAELYRPKPPYIVPYVIQPKVVYDFTKGPGDTVQVDRFKFFADGDTTIEQSLTKSARERSATQTIGVGSSRGLEKDSVILQLREFTGPSDPINPNAPSTFQIAKQTMLTAQRKLWEYGAKAFHDSIGSSNLLDDYRRWMDRVYIGEFLKTSFIYNPINNAGSSLLDGGSADLSRYNNLPPRWRVEDSDIVVTRMTERNAPKFSDGNYWCLCSPEFLRHLERDSEFREVTRYPGSIPVTAMVQPAEPMGIPQIDPSGSFYSQGLMAGQATDVGGTTTMPTGFVYRGVRYFVTNNMPKGTVTLTYTNNGSYAAGPAARTAELAIFFGPEAIGVGLGGVGPQVLFNGNDDFQRFVIAIWQLYGAWELLDERFCSVARSFTN